MITKFHHHFMLTGSAWPLISTINSMNLFFSILFLFKMNNFELLILSLLSCSFSSMVWWFTYSEEFNIQGWESLSLESGLKVSMLLFISSEIFFFFSFFWAYFHFYLSPVMEVGMTWPPYSIIMFNYMNVPLINTLLLLTSGITVTISHGYIMTGEKLKSLAYLSATISLGVFFTMLQWQEYNSSFFCISDSTFGTTFFMLTGFHGIHVIIGSMFLTTIAMKSFKLNSNKKNWLSFEMASWYWHFVDVVWIFLYFLIYYMN